MVARNRFLAEAMLNGGQSLQKSPKISANSTSHSIPKPKKYSVPTCHNTLKQMEQARLAREFEQQRKGLNNNINNNIDESQTGSSVLDQGQEAGNGFLAPKLKRSLSRTTSVGKLVNNFENGTATGITGQINNNYQELLGQTAQAVLLPNFGLKPKPPLAAKPSLRHTVSRPC